MIAKYVAGVSPALSNRVQLVWRAAEEQRWVSDRGRLVMESGQFTVGDLRFGVAHAGLLGVILDPYWCDKYNGGRDKEISWCLNVHATPLEIDGEIWEPTAEWGELQFHVQRWFDIVGVTVSWDSPRDPVSGARYGTFGVFEYEEIRSGLISSSTEPGTRYSCGRLGLATWGMTRITTKMCHSRLRRTCYLRAYA